MPQKITEKEKHKEQEDGHENHNNKWWISHEDSGLTSHLKNLHKFSSEKLKQKGKIWEGERETQERGWEDWERWLSTPLYLTLNLYLKTKISLEKLLG